MTDSTVVLLHGRSLGPAMWRPQQDALGGELRVIAPALPGVGSVPLNGSPTAFRIEHYVVEVGRLLDDVGARSTLVGFSLGGLIAIELALSRPESIGALVLVGTRAEPDAPEVYRQRVAEVRAMAAGDVPPVPASWPRALLGQAPAPAALAAAEDAIDANVPGAVAASAAIAARPDRSEALRGLSLPTFIVHGEEDRVVPVDISVRLHAAIDGSILYTMPGAGHLVNLEEPDAFTNVVRDAVIAGRPHQG